MAWIDICAFEDLVENSGICALLNGQQVAVFLLELQGESQINTQSNWSCSAAASEQDLGSIDPLCDRGEGAQPTKLQPQERRVFAVGNYDPVGGANVLSRGILGSVGEQIVVASPLYKQHFDLTTGQCLEQPDVVIPVYRVKLQQGRVWLNAGQQNQQASAA